MQQYVFDLALVKGAWQRDVKVTLDKGVILSVTPASAVGDATRVRGAAVPAMANVHSHAFQRAFAGLSEHKPAGQSDFWSWRQAMYRFSAAMTPERLFSVARALYHECLVGGYSHVSEFHYLHQSDAGLERAMAEALYAAASDVGLGLTVLPVAYNRGGFEDAPLNAAQKTFHLSSTRLEKLIKAVTPAPNSPHHIGLAFHSLRAVSQQDMEAGLALVGDDAPIHIHIAEQEQEVTACMQAYGARPVRWLLDTMDVDARWCLVHATHITDEEVAGIAASGATVGLCPTTEANLGDGVFPLEAFLAQKGKIAIGSDSNVCRQASEELRLLEYGQRLTHQGRTIGLVDGETSVGQGLWSHTARQGHGVSASGAGEIAVGQRADILVLDMANLSLASKPDDALLDGFIFAGGEAAVQDVMVAGTWQLQAGQHAKAEQIAEDYRTVMREIMA